MENSSLALLRQRHPQIALGWSVPRMRRDPLRNPATALPAVVVLQYVRRALPRVAANRIRRGEIEALLAHSRLVTPRLAPSTAPAATSTCGPSTTRGGSPSSSASASAA